MPRAKIRPNDILQPQKILDNLLNDYISGELDETQNLYRAIVVKVDNVRW